MGNAAGAGSRAIGHHGDAGRAEQFGDVFLSNVAGELDAEIVLIFSATDSTYPESWGDAPR